MKIKIFSDPPSKSLNKNHPKTISHSIYSFWNIQAEANFLRPTEHKFILELFQASSDNEWQWQLILYLSAKPKQAEQDEERPLRGRQKHFRKRESPRSLRRTDFHVSEIILSRGLFHIFYQQRSIRHWLTLMPFYCSDWGENRREKRRKKPLGTILSGGFRPSMAKKTHLCPPNQT